MRFSETRSLSDQNCMLKNFRFLKVSEVIRPFKSRLKEWHGTKNFKLAPIRKRVSRFGICGFHFVSKKGPPHRSPESSGLPKYLRKLGQSADP